MRLNPFARRAAPVAETRQASIENPAVSATPESFLAFFGLGSVNLPRVTTVAALSVPAVAAAVTFLSRTLAALPLDAKRRVGDDESPIGGKIQTLVHDYPNDDMDGFKFRQYFWQQVFTGGRGLAWIERKGAVPVALWPMDPARVTIAREQQKLVYRWENQTYAASEVIDVPFNQMSMWQFMAAVEGYVKANSSDDGKMSSSEVDDVWEWMQSKEAE